MEGRISVSELEARREEFNEACEARWRRLIEVVGGIYHGDHVDHASSTS